MITEKQFNNFQKKLNSDKLYKYFWIFWGNYAFTVFLLVAFVVALNPTLSANWQELLVISASSFFISRVLVVSIINFFIKTVRPYQKYNIKPAETSFFSFRDQVHDSFPSRHTTAYFSVASVVYFFHPALGLILVTTAILAGVGRVIMAWHWPSDILAGAIIGSVIGYFTYLISNSLFFT